jgi:hypothetical protein
MDDLRSLWMTCSSMRRICSHLAVGQRLALDRFRSGWTGADPVNYYTLLASLEACFLIEIQTVFMGKRNPQLRLNDLTHAADGGHNLAAYLVAILLYRHNRSAGDDDTARRCMRQAKGKEESRAEAAGGDNGPTSVPPLGHQGDLQYDVGTVVAAAASTGAR